MRCFPFLLAGAALLLATPVAAQDCIECHQQVSPGIVTDWQLSKHSDNSVDCTVCHGDEHVSMTDFTNVLIPTPDTCADCHSTQVEQFGKGKHAIAWASFNAMPTTHALPVALTQGMKGCGGCHKIGLKSEEDIAAL